MASTQEASVKAVLAALETFSGHPDKTSIERANRWLQDFQHSVRDVVRDQTQLSPLTFDPAD